MLVQTALLGALEGVLLMGRVIAAEGREGSVASDTVSADGQDACLLVREGDVHSPSDHPRKHPSSPLPSVPGSEHPAESGDGATGRTQKVGPLTGRVPVPHRPTPEETQSTVRGLQGRSAGPTCK